MTKGDFCSMPFENVKKTNQSDILFSGILGLPFVSGATVRSLTHLNALCVFSKTYAPGEKPRLDHVIEQRVTSIFFYLLLGRKFLLDVLVSLDVFPERSVCLHSRDEPQKAKNRLLLPFSGKWRWLKWKTAVFVFILCACMGYRSASVVGIVVCAN